MKKENKIKKTNKILILFAFLITLSFSINLEIVENNEIVNNLYKYNIYLYPLVFYGTYKLLGFWVKNCDIKNNKKFFFVGYLISLFYTIGWFYHRYDSLQNMYSNSIQIIKTIFIFFAFGLLITCAISILIHLLFKLKDKKINNSFITFILEKHPSIFIAICFLPIVIIYYPNIAMADGLDELLQFFHRPTWSLKYINLISENMFINGHHSPFHTFIIGMIHKFAYSIFGSANIGAFITVLIQLGIITYVLSYSLKLAKKLKCPVQYRIFMLLFYILSPFINMTVPLVCKDVPFSAMILLLTCFLIEITVLRQHSYKDILKLVVVLIIITLLTNKGMYIALLVIISLIIYLFKDKRKLIILIIPLIVYPFYKNVILTHYKVTPGSVQETLSIPIQQVSRYVITYDYELDKEDKDNIVKVLPYDRIKELYDPRIADPIKNKFNKDYTNEDIKAFIKTWIKLGIKHPGIYVTAFLNNTYGYTYIDRPINQAYFEHHEYDEQKNVPELNYSYPKKLEKSQQFIKNMFSILKRVPIINIFFDLALYNWALIIALIVIFKKNKLKDIIPLIPSFVIMLFQFVSPVSGNRRYAMPIFFTIMVIYALCIYINNNRVRNEVNEKRK